MRYEWRVGSGSLAAVVAALVLPLPSHGTLAADQARFQQLAEQGLAQTRQYWWNAQAGWYMGRRSGDPPVASLWSSYPLLELADAIAIADPTAANKAFVDTTFTQAEGFWDPTIEGTGGITWLWGLRNTGNAYFDDAGWWGLAYLDAYRATGKQRWLWDAGRVLSYLVRYAWDPQGGGMWWDVIHEHKTSEPLAAATLVAATLYRVQHKKYYLAEAKRLLAWANTYTRNPNAGNLYGRSSTDGTVMDYVEGMMVAAHVELCRATKQKSYCTEAERIARASLGAFPELASWAPETDVVYLRWMLDLYTYDKDPRWYALVYENAKRAAANARDSSGFWSLRWDGGTTIDQTLYTQTATLELFAWLAATPPPA
jgi:uncharacterized protein YyaL (SSP411 family)